MGFYAWIKQTSEYLLALALVATVAVVAVAGLAYGWAGLAAGLTAGIVLWFTPWQRLFIAFVRWISVWLYVQDAAPKRVQLAHERLPRRVRRRAPAHLLPYDRIKVLYGEHVAALLVFASGMGVLALAAAVLVLGDLWGMNNPLSKAAATLFFGAIAAFALWRPDVEWREPDDWWVNDPAYSHLPGNIYYSSFNDD